MRGTLHVGGESGSDGGIIPAYAGNTRETYCETCPSRDHPRICGEHVRMVVLLSALLGSSPHMRGTLGSPCPKARCTGIIPAYAGNTESVCEALVANWDHPRICGEHPYRIIPIPEDMGSSPHMRGTRYLRRTTSAASGIIPAYAGNTSSTRLRARPHRDHPRICGEHAIGNPAYAVILGSSPHMRGTPES